MPRRSFITAAATAAATATPAATCSHRAQRLLPGGRAALGATGKIDRRRLAELAAAGP
jgi:hypothetical protein